MAAEEVVPTTDISRVLLPRSLRAINNGACTEDGHQQYQCGKDAITSELVQVL